MNNHKFVLDPDMQDAENIDVLFTVELDQYIFDKVQHSYDELSPTAQAEVTRFLGTLLIANIRSMDY